MKQFLIGAAVAGVLIASQGHAAPATPFVIPLGQKDVRLATAGTYTLDPAHVAILVRVSHIGFSISVFC